MPSLCCNPVLLYFIAQIIPPLDMGSSLSCLLCTFDILPSSSSLFLSIILLPGTAICSRLILYISCPSSKNQLLLYQSLITFLNWRIVLEQRQVFLLLLGVVSFRFSTIFFFQIYFSVITCFCCL